MSVSIKTNNESSTYGHLQIVSNANSLSGEDVVHRMQSIINVIKAVNLEMIDQTDLYFLVSVLEDYLPNEAQAKKMFEVLPKTK
jgi:hypothetical protein